MLLFAALNDVPICQDIWTLITSETFLSVTFELVIAHVWKGMCSLGHSFNHSLSLFFFFVCVCTCHSIFCFQYSFAKVFYLHISIKWCVTVLDLDLLFSVYTRMWFTHTMVNFRSVVIFYLIIGFMAGLWFVIVKICMIAYGKVYVVVICSFVCSLHCVLSLSVKFDPVP